MDYKIKKEGLTIYTKDKYLEEDIIVLPDDSLIPKGTLDITENGTYDVTTYEKLNVNVSQEIDAFLEGTMAEVYNDRVTKIGQAFRNNEHITSVNFPNVETVLSKAFSGATQITTFNLPKLKTINMYGFQYTKITGDNSIFQTVETLNGTHQFNSCASLGDVNMPLIRTIPAFSFSSSGVTSFRADNCATQGGNQAFNGCNNLVSVYFKSLTEVGTQWFNACKALKKAEFNAVKNFRGYAFQGCSALEVLIIRTPDVVATTDSNMFHSATFTGTIYVPDNLVDSYKAATNWSKYAEQIKGLSEYTEIL